MPNRPRAYSALDDRDLVVAFKAGEPGAYDEMYARYSARVGAICRRMLGNREDAREAVQETFLKAYLGLPQFNGNYRLGAWLGRIASNVCIDTLRANTRVAPVVPIHSESSALAVEAGPEEIIVGDGPELGDRMAEIQPLHARALVMRGVEGLSHQEMAGRLSMSPSQVKALLHRARRSFKRTWDQAKGLAAAPLIALRAGQRQLRAGVAATTEMAGAAAGAAPMLAERVAASAVIVAAALSGLPGTTMPSAPAALPSVHRPIQAIESGLAERRPAAPADRAASHVTGTTAAAQSSTLVASVAPSASLAPELSKMLTRARAATHRSHPPRDGSDDHSLPDVSTVGEGDAVNRVGKQVGQIIPPR